METHITAMALLESLPKGWDWSVHKTGDWYYCVIRNDSLHHEPVYTSASISEKALKKRGPVNLNTPESRDMLCCVREAYDNYVKGEIVAPLARETA
jgi:hypothetical protein